MLPWNALIFAIASALLQGVAYAALAVLAHLSPFTVNFYGALANGLFNALALSIAHSWSDALLFRDWTIGVPIAVYVSTTTASNFLFVRGYSDVANTSAGAYVAAASCTPVFTFLFTLLLLRQRSFNVALASVGIAMTTGGIILVALAR